MTHSHSYAIADIRLVNLLTGANKMFGSMWACWEPGEGTNLLLVSAPRPWSNADEKSKLRVVHTSGAGTRFVVGQQIELMDDQSRRELGRWTIAGVKPHTPDGLRDLAELAGKKSLKMATFK